MTWLYLFIIGGLIILVAQTMRYTKRQADDIVKSTDHLIKDYGTKSEL